MGSPYKYACQYGKCGNYTDGFLLFDMHKNGSVIIRLQLCIAPNQWTGGFVSMNVLNFACIQPAFTMLPAAAATLFKT